MKLVHVAALTIIWGTTAATAYLLHVPECFIAACVGTVLVSSTIWIQN